MLQKLKKYLITVFYAAMLLMPVAISGTSLAAGSCPGSDAPSSVDCKKIPLSCPGSTLSGPVIATITLKCPYNPTNDSYTCGVAKCVFPDGTTLQKGQTYGAAKAGSSEVTCPGGAKVPAGTDCATVGGDCSDVSKCDLITKYVNPFINFLAALVGVAVVASIIIGGIQYGSSAGDPQKVGAAKNRIRNAIIALITFMFLYALLNFLIPGGLI